MEACFRSCSSSWACSWQEWIALEVGMAGGYPLHEHREESQLSSHYPSRYLGSRGRSPVLKQAFVNGDFEQVPNLPHLAFPTQEEETRVPDSLWNMLRHLSSPALPHLTHCQGLIVHRWSP
jgi:hypothetical protein